MALSREPGRSCDGRPSLSSYRSQTLLRVTQIVRSSAATYRLTRADNAIDQTRIRDQEHNEAVIIREMLVG